MIHLERRIHFNRDCTPLFSPRTKTYVELITVFDFRLNLACLHTLEICRDQRTNPQREGCEPELPALLEMLFQESVTHLATVNRLSRWAEEFFINSILTLGTQQLTNGFQILSICNKKKKKPFQRSKINK